MFFQAIIRLVAMFMDAAFTATGAPRATRDRDRTLKFVARRLGGTYQPAGRDRCSAVGWRLDTTDSVLHFLETGGGDVEGVRFHIRKGCSFRIRLFPETGWERVRRFFGAQDIRTGDAAFDRVFIVQSDDGSKAQWLLSPEVRQTMTRLSRFGPMTLFGSPNGIVLRTRATLIDDLDQLCAFAGEAVALGRALLQILDPSMVVAELIPVAMGHCPVCGTSIEGDGRECGRCRTPHHQDCWNYLGGCAIFACAGRRGGSRTSA